MRIVYALLIGLIVPYVLLFSDGLLAAEWMNSDIHEIVFGIIFYLSFPGLFIIGIYLCASRKKKIDLFLGIVSIFWTILFIAVYIWALAAGL